MVIETFNSWNILALPPSPGFSSLSVTRRNTVGSTTSPFSMQTKLQAWPGADRIEGHATLPPMARAQASTWDAWMAECCGMLNAFQLPMPFDGKRLPGGAENIGQPVVNAAGANAPGSNSWVTEGWTPSTMRLLLPGDYFQVGYRIHTVLDAVNSDAGGNATVTVWPSIRETQPQGTPLVVFNPKGLFRMAENQQQSQVDESGIWHLEFDFVEAR